MSQSCKICYSVVGLKYVAYISMGLELVEVDFGEVGADVLGVAGVDVLPGFFHAGNLCGVVEMAEE